MDETASLEDLINEMLDENVPPASPTVRKNVSETTNLKKSTESNYNEPKEKPIESTKIPDESSESKDVGKHQTRKRPVYKKKEHKTEEQIKLEEQIKAKLQETKESPVKEQTTIKEQKKEAKKNEAKKEEVGNKPTTEELRARLKAKIKGGERQRQLQEKKKKLKFPSYPLTPIYHCDNKGCNTIMDSTNVKRCPTCLCHCYCSRECQIKDWAERHKLLCGKNPDEMHKAKLELYKQARDVADTLYNKMKGGDYLTVIHGREQGAIASIFTTVAEKSNLLNWKQYMHNSIYTTTVTDELGDIGVKINHASLKYADKKLYMISVMLDRLLENQTSDCVIRLYYADQYGETMDAPVDGVVKKNIIKRQVRYQRK